MMSSTNVSNSQYQNTQYSTVQSRRKLLQDYLASGRMASVEFQKKDGTVTKRTVQLWRESALASGTREFVQHNPASHKEELFTCYSVSGGEEPKWCNISLDKLISVKLGGNEIHF